MPQPGWQQPAIRTRNTCPHLGLISATLSAWSHELGHEWVCVCGKVFVVRENPEGGKWLKAK